MKQHRTVERCSAEIWRTGDFRPSPCSNAWKVERDGKRYCRVHDPEPEATGETVWLAKINYGRLLLTEAEVLKRTPKQVKLVKSHAASGYRTTLPADDPSLFETRADAEDYLIACAEARVEAARTRLAGAEALLAEARKLAEVKP